MKDNILAVIIIIALVLLALGALYILYNFLKSVFKFILRFIAQISNDIRNFKGFISSTFRKKEKNIVKQTLPQALPDEYYENKLFSESTSLYNLGNIFNTSEQYLFYTLSSILKDYSTYILVPKIRIIDFIQIDDFYISIMNYKKTEPYYYNKFIKGKITSKHVDFLICKKEGVGRSTNYKPCIAIEFFGSFHTSDTTTINSDNFKKNLFEKMSLPLVIFKSEDLNKNANEAKVYVSNKISPFLLERTDNKNIIV